MTRGDFGKSAQIIEDTDVSAYNRAGALESNEVLAAANSVVQVEAGHAAALRLFNSDNPAQAAFDETREMQTVLDAVKPFIT